MLIHEARKSKARFSTAGRGIDRDPLQQFTRVSSLEKMYAIGLPREELRQTGEV
jgi:hypothetical protein